MAEKEDSLKVVYNNMQEISAKNEENENKLKYLENTRQVLETSLKVILV